MDENIECLCYHEVEAVEHFELLGMRYGDMIAVTQKDFSCLWNAFSVKLQTAVLQLYLICDTCTIFRTRYSAPEADLELPQLLRWSSLWHYLMNESP